MAAARCALSSGALHLFVGLMEVAVSFLERWSRAWWRGAHPRVSKTWRAECTS